MKLALTGSTGRLGGRVSSLLAAAGVRQTLIVRDAARAPSLPLSDIRVTSYGDKNSAAALAGIDTLFMVSGAEAPDRVRQHVAFIDAAVTAGVSRIVYLSFFGARADATFTLARDHWATEEHLRSTGIAHIVLRDNLYLDFMPMLTGDDGVIRGPAGDGRVSAVAQTDIADALAAVLADPSPHDGRTYNMTGPSAMTMTEIASVLTEFGDRPVSYVAETVAQAYESRAGYGAPDWQLDAWVSTYTAIAAGELSEVTDDVELLTGHPATTLAQLLSR